MENKNLINAVKQENITLVEEILGADTDINVKDETGCTALMIASENGYTEIVRKLILLGANTTLKSNDDSTALTLASKNKHNDIIMLLESLNYNSEDIENVDTLEDCLEAFGEIDNI